MRYCFILLMLLTGWHYSHAMTTDNKNLLKSTYQKISHNDFLSDMAKNSTQSGTNLFYTTHHFLFHHDQPIVLPFSDSAKQNISNIFIIVNASKASMINTVIQSNVPNATLYLMNPNGVEIGEHAQFINFDSIIISSADYIEFEDQRRLSVHDDTSQQVSHTTPKALGFLPLKNDGKGLDSSIKLVSSHINIDTHQTCSLIGGNISLASSISDQLPHISTQGGSIYISALNTPGYLLLSDYSVHSCSSNIIIRSHNSGRIDILGKLDVSGMYGGKIILSGDSILIREGSILKANGKLGGGQIYIGGGLNGNNPTIENAYQTHIEKNVLIEANALDHGNGGDVIIYANNLNQFWGKIIGQGGAYSGHGGFVEVSSQKRLVYKGHSDLSSPTEDMGQLLIDPSHIIIQGGTGADDLTDADAYDDPNDTVTISEATLESATSHVILQATDSISLTGTFQVNTNGEGTGSILRMKENVNLTLQTRNGNAEGSGGIQLTGTTLEIQTTGTGDIILQTGVNGNDTGTAHIALDKMTILGSGDIEIQSEGDITILNRMTSQIGDIQLISGNAISIQADIISASGDISLVANSRINSTIDGDIQTASDGTLFIHALNGSITMSQGTQYETAGGAMTLSALSHIILGEISASESGHISITSQNGSIGKVAVSDAVQITANAATLTAAGPIGNLTPMQLSMYVNDLTTFTSNSNQWLETKNGLTGLNGTSGSGNIIIYSNQTITDNDSNTDLSASEVSITITNGNFGSGSNNITTNVNYLNLITQNGSQWITEMNSLMGFQLNAGTGHIVLISGDALIDNDSDLDITANELIITLISGSFGSITQSIQLSVNELTLDTRSENGNQWIQESNGLQGLNCNAGLGNIQITSTGALTDSDMDIDFIGTYLDISISGGNLGTSQTSIHTQVASLDIDTSQGNFSQWISELDGVTGISLSAGQGHIILISGGSVLDHDHDTDISCQDATITLASGDFGEALYWIQTSANQLSINTSGDDGWQWFKTPDTLSTLTESLGNGRAHMASPTIWKFDNNSDNIIPDATGLTQTNGNPAWITTTIVQQVGNAVALSEYAGTFDLTMSQIELSFTSDQKINIMANLINNASINTIPEGAPMPYTSRYWVLHKYPANNDCHFDIKFIVPDNLQQSHETQPALFKLYQRDLYTDSWSYLSNASQVLSLTEQALFSGVTKTGYFLTSQGNQSPEISNFSPIEINEDTILSPFTFTINDADDLTLTIEAISSNTTLIPYSNMLISGSESSRNLDIELAPNQFGHAVITVTVSDALTSISTSFNMTVIAINDAPILQPDRSWIMPDILINDFYNQGATVTDLIIPSHYIENDPNDPKGIFITDVLNKNGQWQYTTNGGDTWFDLDIFRDTSGLLLQADDGLTRIRIVPDPYYAQNQLGYILFRAWDQSYGSNGQINVNKNDPNFATALSDKKGAIIGGNIVGSSIPGHGIPTLNEWGMLILSLILIGYAIMVSKQKRIYQNGIKS